MEIFAVKNTFLLWLFFLALCVYIMEHGNRKVQLILKKLRKEELSETESEELESWLAESEKNRQFFDIHNREDYLAQQFEIFDRIDEEAALKKLLEQIHFDMEEASEKQAVVIPRYISIRRKWWRIGTAAAILLLIVVTYFSWKDGSSSKPPSDLSMIQRYKNDVMPGFDKATLTLADGKKILLDSSKNGMLAIQNNTQIFKTKEGSVTYNVIGKEAQNRSQSINILTTPKGGYVQVTLPDNTKAWLNAESSLRFPCSFSENERNVEITGEVYFEVAKNPQKPFKVKYRNTEVIVLGTHFNLKAYHNDGIETTLLEGSVRVQYDNKSTVLKPNEQIRIASNGDVGHVKSVPIEEVVAWKENLFYYSNTDLKTIMKDIERWYDVDVGFSATVNTKFSCLLSRSLPVSKILKILESSGGVHFVIEGKTITVLP